MAYAESASVSLPIRARFRVSRRHPGNFKETIICRVKSKEDTNMAMNDPIADMLTRIRNANTAKHDTVDVPVSKMKTAIANILVDEGYIAKYEITGEGVQKNLHITLKYGKDKNERIISGIKRISKPGLRVYAGSEDMPKVLGGLGIAIVSTNKGVITDKEARKQHVGGEVLAFVW
jgi:small subunit ribosomal protein S8